MTDAPSSEPGEALEHGGEALSDEAREARAKAARSPKKILLFVLKLVFTVGMLVVIYSKVLKRDGAEDLLTRLGDLSWGWVAMAILMQLTAITFATLRWKTLLNGQGIKPSWRFLGGSIMIARFWGAFTPGGFTGFGGWRIFDVAQHTKKVARATATIGVEMLLGKVAFGVVVMLASVFGIKFVGTSGVLLINAVFFGIVVAALTLVSRPRLFLRLANVLPAKIRTRVQTMVDAIGTYHGQGRTLFTALVCGVGVHAFNNMIYVCAARALDVQLGMGEVFFASSLQILATLLPASINGIGLRETTAVALYTSASVGLPLSVAILIPTVGFACEMFVSAFGGVIFLLRRDGYDPQIEIEDNEREAAAHAAIETVPREEQPIPVRGLTIGLGAGVIAGLLIGLVEAGIVVQSAGGRTGLGVLAYGALVYAIFCGVGGAAFGFVMAHVGRFMERRALEESDAYAYITALIASAFAFALGAFRIRRDVFHEELVWKSIGGLGLLLGCALAAGVLFLILAFSLRFIMRKRPGQFLLRAWGSPVFGGLAVALIAGVAMLLNGSASGQSARDRGEASDQASNILFIVVDTLRADHLPGYGYEEGATPNLEAFANDAVRFDQAFANASWTRPSFASILTGRLPASHSVMGKPDELPDDLTTLPEALQGAGYHTEGYVTNFNVGPYFNFQQGFDHYEFMEPALVLGADDNAQKLLLVQVLRRVVEKVRSFSGGVEPGSVYQDAATVNAKLSSFLERAPADPWFLFVGYMDPHDPYYAHPYDGSGYGRAAHQHPDLEEADGLRALYDGEITYWDARFGELVAELKAKGVYEDLTIVITSDHGEEFGEHGGFWHGTTLYDEQVRVPLYVKLPQNRRGGTSVRHWVQSIDLMPTLLSTIGAERPEGVQGGDLFEGTDVVYAEESHEGNQLESVRQRRGNDELKIITANAGNPRGLAEVELYQMDVDELEQNNLAEAQASDVEAMRTILAAQRSAAQTGAVQGQGGNIEDMDDDAIARLCELGYMDREGCCGRGLQQYCD